MQVVCWHGILSEYADRTDHTLCLVQFFWLFSWKYDRNEEQIASWSVDVSVTGKPSFEVNGQ